MRNGFKVIDADAHFYEPSDIWNKYVEPQYYDSRPRVLKVHAKSILEYEGEEPMNALKSKSLFSMMDAKFGHAFRDDWSLESHLKDLKTEGWVHISRI